MRYAGMVEAASKRVYTVQVKELVEFALRRGDLGSERDFTGPGRALEGIKGHQKVQRSRGAAYLKEVSVLHECEEPDFVLRVQGRIDGILKSESGLLLEEIKTVQGSWDGVPDPLHWAQLQFYACMYDEAASIPEVSLRLTYLDIDTGKVSEFQEVAATAALRGSFRDALELYLDWMREYHAWCKRRNASISKTSFPYSSYRPKQREAAVAAYRVARDGGRIFIEAPTGIGKTISVLFPTLKALGEGHQDRIYYLTARTPGRIVAENALADLRGAGARLRTLTLTAKEKICVQGPEGCDCATCPLAKGYYDRNRPAMREALERESITRATLEQIGQAHQVCPFELSLDVSSWVDVIVCDYNYVFDPKVYLRRHFDRKASAAAFLVDEAHNLVDRGREMFSADLSLDELRTVRRKLSRELPRCARAISRLITSIRKFGKHQDEAESDWDTDGSRELNLFGKGSAKVAEVVGPTTVSVRHQGIVARELPESVLESLDHALKQAEAWLARNEPAGFREELLQLYFRLHSFRRTADLVDEHYVVICEEQRLRLFCLDPSRLLADAAARGKSAIFFSATLSPPPYYRELLGGTPDDEVMQLPSPFPPQNLLVLVNSRVRTDYRGRVGSLGDVVDSIAALVQARTGNYLVYLPSYQYLSAVHEQFVARFPEISALLQRPGLSETEREAFLNRFSSDRTETLVGFAVMGGLFGEGIDLTGERLIGAVVVGVGLPQVCLERDLIRNYFDAKEGSGFNYGYTFPGMNRVLQAAGRVIRSERDRGAVLLIDARFAEQRYRRLMPPWWRPVAAGTTSEVSETAKAFWKQA